VLADREGFVPNSARALLTRRGQPELGKMLAAEACFGDKEPIGSRLG